MVAKMPASRATNKQVCHAFEISHVDEIPINPNLTAHGKQFISPTNLIIVVVFPSPAAAAPPAIAISASWRGKH